jgi:palmitoyltransferase ZDHHC9/14/18
MWSIFDRITRTESRRVGNHRLILNGRLTIGPNFVFAVLVFLSVVFAGLAVTHIVYQSSLVLGIFVLMMIKTELVLIISVALIDPGIIPPASGDVNGKKTQLTSIVNGTKVDQKWCHTCNVYMPPRGKHCGDCGCCIDKHDHHCKFLSNCVGIRNYRSFVLLLMTSAILCLFNVLYLLLRSAPIQGINIWILFVGSIVLFLVCGNLVFYHGKLILRGSTSYEQYRGFTIGEDDEEQTVGMNPFSLGSWQANLNAFLATPTEPSRVGLLFASNSIKPVTVGSKAATEEEMTAVLDASPLA